MSYLPEDVRFSPDEEEGKDDIKIMYRKIMQFTRGTRGSFTPTVEGSTSTGTVTYTAQTAWYIRAANIVDYWFQVAWSNWVGGAGDIRLILPSTVIEVEANYFVGSMTNSNITYANALDTWCQPRGATGKNYANIISGRRNASAAEVQVQATGQLTGHIRYWSQENS